MEDSQTDADSDQDFSGDTSDKSFEPTESDIEEYENSLFRKTNFIENDVRSTEKNANVIENSEHQVLYTTQTAPPSSVTTTAATTTSTTAPSSARTSAKNNGRKRKTNNANNTNGTCYS